MNSSDNKWLLIAAAFVAVLFGAMIGFIDVGFDMIILVALLPIALVAGSKYPEVVLALYLYAGAFKTVLPLPVDLTVVLGLATAAHVLYQIGQRGMPRLGAGGWLFLCVILLVVAGVVLSTSDGYGVEKASRFATLGVIAFFGGAVLLRDEHSIERFALSVMMIGVIMSAYAVLLGGSAALGDRFTAFGSNTIALGRSAAVTIAVAAIYALWRPRALLWAAPVALISLFALVGSGSRGPAVAVVVSLGLLMSYRVWTRGARRLTVITVVAMTSVVATSFWRYIPEASLSRLSGFLSGEIGTSGSARLMLAAEAIARWVEHPVFGYGTGSFYRAVGVHIYPHNILLELAVENGLVTLIPFLVSLLMCVFYAISVVRVRPGVSPDFVLIALLIATVNSLVSGDLNDNRFLYAIMATSLVVMRDLVDSTPKAVSVDQT